jgi:uroporphyrinogen-III decarboxylase
MKWSREQYIELMTFGDVERPMFVELFGPLIGLPEEWRAQGASEDEINMVAFDWDFVERVSSGGNTGAIDTRPNTLIEETDRHRIERDYLGRTMKLDKTTATIALPLSFPVETMDDWQRIKKHFVYREDRINWEQVAIAKQEQAAGKLIVAGIPGAFDTVRNLMGEEMGCMAYYLQPELIADIMATLTDTATRVLKELVRELQIDQLSVHEDFAGKSGPLIGPVQIAEHMQPYYRSCWEIVQEAGGKIFQQDSDGNINPVVDALLDCGLTCLFPMEPAAGMDIVKIREQYGTRVAVAGGIDKHVLRQGKAAIDKELDYKLQPMMRNSGGVVFGLDHRITNGTPLENYRYYVKRGREILGLPPLSPQRRGWMRMAF